MYFLFVIYDSRSKNHDPQFTWFATPSIIQFSLTKNRYSYPHGKILKMPIHKEVNRDFFKEWSAEMAYILGFFAADGNMIRNKRGAHFIEFQITDKTLLYAIRKVLCLNHKITARNRGENYKKSYRLQIGSKKIFSDLEILGMTPKKSNTLKFPEVPRRYFGDFVRGYFDGDGYVGIGKYWRKNRKRFEWQFSTSFVSGSSPFLSGLKNSLRTIISGGGISQKKDGSHELVLSKHGSIALFNLMYNNTATELLLKRKHKVFLRAFKVLKLQP